jgi:Predicted transcriptional regulator
MAVKIDLEMKARIQRLGDARHRSMHWLMKEAIRQFVEREEQQEALRQAGIQAWEAYQDTGLHVTQEEADTWMARLEAGEDVEPPPLPRLIWSPPALLDVQRLYRFLADRTRMPRNVRSKPSGRSKNTTRHIQRRGVRQKAWNPNTGSG